MPPVRFRADDIAMIVVIAVAVAFSFTRLRGVTWARRAFQVVLIGYVGFWNGQLLAQSLFAGWAELGMLSTAPSSDRISAWLSRRRSHLAEGRSNVRVGHLDIFARPTGAR